MELTTTVNDEARVVEVDGTESVVDVVRDGLGLTGTKLVCGSGVCGACTVLVDGEPVLGCLTPATRLRDADVTTVEGLADGDDLHPVQRAFAHHDGLQCGYCTPGFVVSAVSLPRPVACRARRRRARRTRPRDDRRGARRPPVPVRLLRGDLPRGCRRVPRRARPRCWRPARRARGGTGQAHRSSRLHDRRRAAGHAARRHPPVRPGRRGRRADQLPEGVLGIDVLGDDRRVRWAGQPIAVVAAESAAAAAVPRAS